MIYPTTIPPAPILGDLATPTYSPALPTNHIFEKTVSVFWHAAGTPGTVWCRSGSLGASGLGAATTNYRPPALRTSPVHPGRGLGATGGAVSLVILVSCSLPA